MGASYQSSGIGAVEAEESDGRNDLVGGSRGGVGPGLDEGSRGPRGAEKGVSRQHGWRCVV